MDKELKFTKDEENEILNVLKNKDSNLSYYAAKDEDAVYEDNDGYKGSDIYRGNYDRDIDSILNNVFYNRFSDKTQVHSFYKNDDVTRRALHVQFVSRIAKNIGKILNLNLELIEAISIGHDMGHTPFGHRGEKFLSALYFNEDKKYFQHNVHSVKVLRDISKKENYYDVLKKSRGISLQVLDGILCHNGEFLVDKLQPSKLKDFKEFEKKYSVCYFDNKAADKNVANTLEGCLVRICDMIAYIGKDRNDLFNVKKGDKYNALQKLDHGLGTKNSTIIKNIITNLLKNSLNKPYIKLDSSVTKALDLMKKDNYKIIYDSPEITREYDVIKILFERIFNAAINDLKNGTDKTYIRKHFIDELYLKEYKKDVTNGKYTNADITVDYIACMTDDYLIDLCKEMNIPEVKKVVYTGYFGKEI